MLTSVKVIVILLLYFQEGGKEVEVENDDDYY